MRPIPVTLPLLLVAMVSVCTAVSSPQQVYRAQRGGVPSPQQVYRAQRRAVSSPREVYLAQTGGSRGKAPLSVGKVESITFLVSVNDTWGSCIATVKTPRLRPKVPVNESERIIVGGCDSGPLTYYVQPGAGGNVTIELTFYSSVVEDASHPTCSIPFSGSFLTPTTLGEDRFGLPSVLPGCSTADSREGYHMTYYWFYIYDWYTG